MTRETKERSERRNELIAAAWALFQERGYDQASVQAIIDRVGVSKGAFYHHFKSKEALLEAAVDGMMDEWSSHVQAIVADEEISAIGKLNLMMDATGRWKAGNIDQLIQIAAAMMRPDNLFVRDLMERRMRRRYQPLLADIIRQGVADGVFDVDHPDEMAEMLILVADGGKEANTRALLYLPQREAAMDEIERRLRMIEQAYERLLCAPPDSIELVDPAVLDRFRAWARVRTEQ